ncbi:MAG: WYL domain-containing protein [Anaerosomatales bacterium]|nr:WYL domain-containing protein [Anaerosomatales bacterium]
MAARPTAAARARRLLAILPRLEPNAEVPLASLAASVGAAPEELAADITTLSLCGVPPFDPLSLVDVYIDGETVVVGMGAPALDRPVRLSPAEGRALIAALETAGFVPTDPLLAKVAAALSAEVDPTDIAAHVRTASAEGGLGDVHATVMSAAERGESIDATYFSAGSGRTRMRRIRPLRVFVERGVWYVVGYDEGLAEERTFRLDRMRDAVPTGERFERPAGIPDIEASFRPSSAPHAADVLLDDASGAEERDWPGATIEPATSGTGARLRVPYATPGWLARRVVASLGAAEVVGPAEARAAVRELATKLLAELEGGDRTEG